MDNAFKMILSFVVGVVLGIFTVVIWPRQEENKTDVVKSVPKVTLSQDLTPEDVILGRSFIGKNNTLEKGALQLVGDATSNDVMTGKKFYSNSFEIKEGTWNFQGSASESDVLQGKTYYSNNGSLRSGLLSLTGNASTNDVMAGKTFYSNGINKQTGSWIFSGDATESNVVVGKKFYSDSGTLKTGTLQLLGDATPADVMNGKRFYSDSLTEKTGEWVFSGTATVGDVVTGKTFYGNSSTLLEGTAPAPIDYSLQRLATVDDYFRDYQGEEVTWTTKSGSPFTNYSDPAIPSSGLRDGRVKQDTRTGLYWTSGSRFNITNNFVNSGDGARPTGGNAIAFCDALASITYAGLNNWYLPTQKELMQAYIDGIFSQDYTFGTYDQYWSSTRYSGGATSAFSIYLSTGTVEPSSKNGSGIYVRCIGRE